MYRLKVANLEEIDDLYNYLLDQTLIKFAPVMTNNPFWHQVQITFRGHSFLKQELEIDSKKVFIAMQFDWEKYKDPNINNSTKEHFFKAIKKACSRAGYEEADILSSNHTNFITDQIITEIRNSRFVIADFTFNNHGAYFESGFARALKKSVIHTVNETHINGIQPYMQIHFDIKQINYIAWSDPLKLEEDLYNRIKALDL